MEEVAAQTPPQEPAAPEKVSVLHEHFHVQFKGGAAKPPKHPGLPSKSSPSKSNLSPKPSSPPPQHGSASPSTISPHASVPLPGVPGSSQPAGGTSSTHPSTAADLNKTGRSTAAASSVSKVKARQASTVQAALQAVLNKQEKGIRGLSSAPDDSLQQDKVNKDVLKKMRETFEHADQDGTGELTPAEFVESFLGVLQTEDGGDEAALRKLFMRIDANSDGTINWDEFSTFMLLESQGSANLRDLENSISFEPAEEWTPNEGVQHDKIITHISHATLANGADRYVTCSKDGMVKVWNAKDLKLLRTLPVGRTSWVTCAKILPNTKKLAVTAFSRCMKIYDLQTYELCGQIQELEYAPMCADVWAPARKKDTEMVAFGDGGGFVRLHELRVNPMEEKTSNDRFLDACRWKHQQHTDWVTCIKYIEELNTVVAGSLDKCISLTDAEDRTGVKTLQGHVKGVSALDWSPAYKFIVSGSQDRRLMLWNPFSLKPLATLQGHLASVTAVMVNDRDNQIVSVSADKQVKLWDIRNHKCIQTLADREVLDSGDEDTLLAAVYDTRRKLLVTGNTYPKVWRQTITAAASCGHRSPVTRVLYNPQFNEAVSADQAGSVSVWHVPSGKLRFRFDNTHPGHTLTALNFDGVKRRLLTGSDNGEVKVWNFSSGACLCVLRARPGSASLREEVTCCLTLRSALFKHFVIGGWDRKVTLYEDPGPSQKETYPGRVISGHQADILDMAVMEGTNVLVSCADDGEVCTWNVESGALRRRSQPKGHEQLPMNQQAIERVAFLAGKLHHIFVTVGADRWLRFWDCATNNVLLELFTGHQLGETIQGLALHPHNACIATGDGAGFVKVWDTSRFTGTPELDSGSAAKQIPEVAVWRAHKSGITSMDWVHAGKDGDFILTSSMDKTVSLWAINGSFIGQFGAHVWILDMPASWRSAEPFALDPRDQLELEASKQVPRRPRATGDDLSSLTSSRMQTPRGGLNAGELPSSIGVSVTGGPPGSRPGTANTGNARVASARSRLPRVSLGYVEEQGGAGPPARRSIANLKGSMLAGSKNSPRSGLRASATGSRRGSMLGGAAGALTVDTARDADSIPAVPSNASLTAEDRGSTSPDQLSRVLAASQKDRLRRLHSLRQAERPEDFLPGGRYSQRNRSGGLSRKNSQKNNLLSGLPPALVPAGSGNQGDAGDAGDADSEASSSSTEMVEESDTSSQHSSDADVPRALWLEEFDLARRAAAKSGGRDCSKPRRCTQSPRRKSEHISTADPSTHRKDGSPLHQRGKSSGGASPAENRLTRR